MGIKVHSAGEWILDNFYIIEENVKSIQKDLSVKRYKQMLGISNGKYIGFARCYVLASEIIAFTDCKIDKETIKKDAEKASILELYKRSIKGVLSGNM